MKVREDISKPENSGRNILDDEVLADIFHEFSSRSNPTVGKEVDRTNILSITLSLDFKID